MKYVDGTSSKGSDTTILKEGIVEFTKHEKCLQDYPVISPYSSQSQVKWGAFCVYYELGWSSLTNLIAVKIDLCWGQRST